MPPKSRLRKIYLTATAREDLAFWEQADPKVIQKINTLLASALIDPFNSVGKPERLKYGLAGTWSRRINHRDRMVYQVSGDMVIVLQLRDHY
jgi:toxin YoeB